MWMRGEQLKSSLLSFFSLSLQIQRENGETEDVSGPTESTKKEKISSQSKKPILKAEWRQKRERITFLWDLSDADSRTCWPIEDKTLAQTKSGSRVTVVWKRIVASNNSVASGLKSSSHWPLNMNPNCQERGEKTWFLQLTETFLLLMDWVNGERRLTLGKRKCSALMLFFSSVVCVSKDCVRDYDSWWWPLYSSKGLSLAHYEAKVVPFFFRASTVVKWSGRNWMLNSWMLYVNL